MELLDEFIGILYSSIVIPMVPLCFYPVQGYLRSRVSGLVVKIVLAFAGMALLLALIGHYVIPLPIDTNPILLFIGIYSFYLYNREVRLSLGKKLFMFMTACLVGGFSFLFATVVDYTLYPSGNHLEFSMEAFTAQMLFLLLADVILYLPLSRYVGWMMANFHEEAVWKRLCLFPTLFFLALYGMFPREYSTMYVANLRKYYPFILFCLFLFVILSYFLFYVIAFNFVQRQKMDLDNQILSMQGAQYQQLLRTVEENSRIRHDFRQQLIVISELVGQKEYDKLEEFVHKYIKDAQAEVKLYSYSAAVNALISYYEAICLREQIRPDFSISLPKKLPIMDQDFCVLLGNLLENAIEGSKDVKDSYISLKIRQTASNMLAVKIVNPYSGELKKEGGYYQSSKRGGFGQGLRSVNTIADKYQGVMEILEEKQIFTVKVLLQIEIG